MTFFPTIRTMTIAATLLSAPALAQEPASQFKMPEECAAVPAQGGMAGGMAGGGMQGGPMAGHDMSAMGNPGGGMPMGQTGNAPAGGMPMGQTGNAPAGGMPMGQTGNAPAGGQVPPSTGGMPAMGGMGMANMQNMPEHMRKNMRSMAVTMPAMMQGMMSKDPDTAFACGMIAHHQAAIDMAQVLLADGKDPTMRAMAESIITSQKAEMAEMQTWLTQNAKK